MSPNVFIQQRRPRQRVALDPPSIFQPYSGETSVADCDSVTVSCFEFTPSGLVNGTSSQCADYNTTIQVTRYDETACLWIVISDITANISYSAMAATWYLTFAGGVYSTASFSDAGGTFDYVGSDGSCSTFPATIDVTPCP